MKFVILFFVLSLGLSALGQNPSVPEVKKKTAGNVLDFDAEVIEGERKTPDLFIQLSMDKAKSESVLFDRKNFNDFHKMDSVKRPKYQEN